MLLGRGGVVNAADFNSRGSSGSNCSSAKCTEAESEETAMLAGC